MSIGATLAAARRRSGLTVYDVSQGTRVTEPIIRGIEQDDYTECGGDFYARGISAPSPAPWGRTRIR